LSHQVVRDIVAYLHTTWNDVLPQDVALSIGVPPGGDVPAAYVAIAYGGDDRAGITGSAFADDGANTGEHSAQDVSIWCTISTASGDQNALAQMDITQGIYDSLVDALNVDWRFGGLLKGESIAGIGNFEWILEDGGQVATLFFTVVVQARWLQ